VLWYISLGESYSNAARLGGVSDATVDRYVAIYRKGGIEGLKRFDWHGLPSELVSRKATLEDLFRAEPSHTTAEACRRIEEATGVKRGLTQVRNFLKKVRVRSNAVLPRSRCLPRKQSRDTQRLRQISWRTRWNHC